MSKDIKSKDIKTLAPLLRHISPLLKRQGLRRESDEWDLAIFARKSDEDMQRVGLGLDMSRNKSGELQLAVLELPVYLLLGTANIAY